MSVVHPAASNSPPIRGSALVEYLHAREAFVGIEGQHELVFDGKANTLACASGSHFSIAAVGAEDAIPEDNVTAVVGICLTALQCMVAMMLLCGSKEPVPDRHLKPWAGWHG